MDHGMRPCVGGPELRRALRGNARNQAPTADLATAVSLSGPAGRPLRFWALSQAGGRPRRGPLPAASLSRLKIASSICSRSRRRSARIFVKFIEVPHLSPGAKYSRFALLGRAFLDYRRGTRQRNTRIMLENGVGIS